VKKMCMILTFIIIVPFLVACNLQKAGTPRETNPDVVATTVLLTLAAYTQSAQPVLLASQTQVMPTKTEPVSLTPTTTPTIGMTPTTTLTQAPTNTPIPKPGTIAGSISNYPYGSVPKLTIVAFGQEAPYNYSYLITAAGDTSFSMTSNYTIPGRYQVVVYDASGHTGGCSAIVTVISDQTVTCNISHWGGGYPAKPSGVPNP
jgi:hypothetical protein